MTNEELIRRFFTERIKGDEESYGFYVTPSLKGAVGNFTLYSKSAPSPLAVKEAKDHWFLISNKTPLTYGGINQGSHYALVGKIAKQLDVSLIVSPYADKAKFQKYMEKKINSDLRNLAYSLNGHPRDKAYAFTPKYQKLIDRIHTLLDGEILLKLPKNQVSLLDTNEVQQLWIWLIKKNPNMEDRKLLRRMYTLSRLLAPKGREKIKHFKLGEMHHLRFL